jgi:hypothetical protein
MTTAPPDSWAVVERLSRGASHSHYSIDVNTDLTLGSKHAILAIASRFSTQERAPMSENNNYLTVQQFASIFRVSPRAILNWIHGGSIPEDLVARKGPGETSRYLIHISAVNILESEFGLVADMENND